MPGCLPTILKVIVTRAALVPRGGLMSLSTTLAARCVRPLRSQVSLMRVTLG